jgi:hypothetical protein
MEEAEEKPPVVQRPHMPHRPDMRVQLEVVDELCHVMTSHRVVPVPPRDILRVEDLSTTWRHFPHDMTMLMHHIVGVINLIDTLRVVLMIPLHLAHQQSHPFNVGVQPL